MAFGSYYSGGGQNADYRADLNFGGGGSGGAGGGGNLNAQMQAMSNFDPTALLNKMLEYGAAQQRYAANRGDWEYGRAKKAGQDAARMASMQMSASPRRPSVGAAASYSTPTARLSQTASQLAGMSGPAWGDLLSAGRQETKWMPAAGKLIGVDFDNGWDTYAKLAGAGVGFADSAGRGLAGAGAGALDRAIAANPRAFAGMRG
jgi:hypothetical protein